MIKIGNPTYPQVTVAMVQANTPPIAGVGSYIISDGDGTIFPRGWVVYWNGTYYTLNDIRSIDGKII